MSEPRVEERWKDRRVLAMCLGVAIVGLPVAFAVGVTLLAEHFVERPVAVLPIVLWCVGVLAWSSLAFLVAERVARRALPLKVLLRMGLAFPDRAPRRLAIAWRAASVRDLDRKVAEARAHGIADEPTEAAARIVTLAAAESAHDRATRGHSERVRALTDMISDELHLGAADRDRLRWSALLHDVGKLAVHADILNKAGALTDEEWEQIRLHPLEGAKLTEPLAAWLGSWASTIAEHHERYDGNGYPRGLAGKDISHGGRIVAVADAYDVMTAARAYKKAMGPVAARQELTANAGSQFDPEVVKAFLAVSLWRLRFVAPLSWLGSFGLAPFATAGRLGAAAGQTIATGLAAAAAIVALSLGAPVRHAPVPASSTVANHLTTQRGHAPGDSTPPAGSTTSTTTAAPAAGPPPATTATPGAAGGAPTTTTQRPSSASTTTSPGATSSTTTTAPGSSSTTTTTTVPGSSSTTTTTTTTVPAGSTTTTTTTTTAATTTTVVQLTPPAPPTGLYVTGGCRLIVVGPELILQWTASTTGSVASYVVLRSTNGDTFSVLGTVSAATVSYTDTSVQANKTYWYEVEATSPGGTATSGDISAVAPVLCV
jgi:hypothetical protein